MSEETENIRKGTKEAIAFKLAAGHIHKCSDCRKLIGKSFAICGECENRRNREAIALANGIKLGEKLHKGRELSAEAKKNIGAANRRKVARAVDNSK